MIWSLKLKKKTIRLDTVEDQICELEDKSGKFLKCTKWNKWKVGKCLGVIAKKMRRKPRMEEY